MTTTKRGRVKSELLFTCARDPDESKFWDNHRRLVTEAIELGIEKYEMGNWPPSKRFMDLIRRGKEK